jgi:arabinofuranosyltransferase
MRNDMPLSQEANQSKGGKTQRFPISLTQLGGLLFAMALMTLYAAYFDRGSLSVYDDSFISFRYANNLASGEGLVFNPGERVEGYTNFLWTLLLALGIRLGVDPVIAGKVLATVAGWVTIWVSFDIVRTEVGSAWGGVLTAVMLSATPGFSRLVVSGMETLLFGMFVVAAVWAFLCDTRHGRYPVVSSVLLALAALTRPEGLLVFGVLSVEYALNLSASSIGWRAVARSMTLWIAGFLLIYGPYFMWRFSYYGVLLPNTFYVKVGTPGVAQIGRGLVYLRDVLLLLNPQIALCLLLGIGWRKRPSTQRLLYAVVLSYIAYLVLVGGDQQAYFGARFVVPLYPLVYVLGVAGASGIARRLPDATRRLFVAGLLALLGLVFSLWSHYERIGYQRLSDTMHRGWHVAAEWLVRNSNSGDVLAADAAGITPYYTGLYTIDMFGLNDFHIGHLDVAMGSGLVGHEKSDAAYVLERRPTYVQSWLSERGEPMYFLTAPSSVRARMDEHCRLRAAVLMRTPLPGEEPLIQDPVYNVALHDMGYSYGVFRCTWTD